MKAIFRILGTAAAVAATGAAIVIMDKFLNEKAAPFIESIEFPEDAEQDDAEAQCQLGVCYEFGYGVAKSLEQAAGWYRKAAEQGYAGAQYSLGDCYYYGKGVEEDKRKAVKWYQEAAERDNAGAQCNLGYCYEMGNGVEKNLAKAAEWLSLIHI